MEGERKSDKIIVSWGREKIPLEFDNKDDIDDKKERKVEQGQAQESVGSLEKATLKQLKERLKKITGVPVNGQKIIFSGAVMKDESATLGSFGLHHNSKILLIGSKPNANDLAETSTNSSEEHALIQKITQLLHKSKTTLIPQIESFEISVKSFLDATSSSSSSSSSSSPPATSPSLPSPPNNNNNNNNNDNNDTNLKTKLQDMHHYIVENLMQSLLVLDGIDFSSSTNSSQEFTTARQKRRDAVKFTQQLIDRVDEVKEKLLKANNSTDVNNNDIISGGGGDGAGTGVGIVEDGNVERQNVEGEN